jgi:hypothetical protein
MEALLDTGRLFQSVLEHSAALHTLTDSVQLTVVYSTRFLESEAVANNFFVSTFNTDRLLPAPTYD